MPTTTSHLFEVSWEVCNKVGGIYTVITSKLSHATAQFSGHYTSVGPYLPYALGEFSEQPMPEEFKAAAEKVAKEGIIIHYGTWLVEGEPPVILVDWSGLVPHLNDLKSHWWEKHELDTLGSDFYDLDQPLLWSWAVGTFIEEYARSTSENVIAHAHEWLSAGVVMRLAESGLKNACSAFTTHATVLGRALSSHDTFIYDKFGSINADQAAKEVGVSTKHRLEKLAATLASVFTTVSNVTAAEATAFLGRKPEVVTMNGINELSFPAFDELCTAHTAMREKLHDFVSAYFFPSYRFDLGQTSYQFTMGRYETHNKGYDTYLESLSHLNEDLKKNDSKKTVVSFILVPGDSLRLKPETASQITLYNRIALELQQSSHTLYQSAYRSLWEKKNVPELDPETKSQLNHLTARLSRKDAPDISPYELRQGDNDEIVRLCKKYGLDNEKEDRVKVIFMPIYLEGFDGIFNIPLYELIPGFDLGVFPSLYEPWGYTPMESLALGVPAITSDLAGFGQSLAENSPQSLATFVLRRSQGKPEETVSILTDYLKKSVEESERSWLLRRMDAYSTIQTFSWNILYKDYVKAYEIALKASA